MFLPPSKVDVRGGIDHEVDTFADRFCNCHILEDLLFTKLSNDGLNLFDKFLYKIIILVWNSKRVE